MIMSGANNEKNKTDILQSIRQHKMIFPSVHEDITAQTQASGLSLPELKELFIGNLKAAGAEVIMLKKEEADAYIVSAWAGALDFNRPEIIAKYSASCSLEILDGIEHAVLRGNFGVAENGAIWLEDKDLSHRIVPFITLHLVLKLDVGEIVATMQDAYQRIRLGETGFGAFISGPSKTADIEQSLVYGAHGAKELTVLLI
jgi:L-lactate dehydrogenase complex protein LldG